MRATRPSRSSAPCIAATARARRRWCEYGFRLPSALDNRPLKFEEWERLAPQMIFVSATPGPYEAQEVIAGGRAGRAADRAGRSGRSRCGRCARRSTTCCPRSTAASTLQQRVLVTTLTKRMAEDLTEYLHEHGVRVRYLHADIETVERVEIIRDLRLGRFDVLVGINLLREGLDMPEVALVAILDADKEGFLRSEGSLIQTMGRAARNVARPRDSLCRQDRPARCSARWRRPTGAGVKQVEYNEAHGITPRSIVKPVADIMEGARLTQGAASGAQARARGRAQQRLRSAQAQELPPTSRASSSGWRPRCIGTRAISSSSRRRCCAISSISCASSNSIWHRALDYDAPGMPPQARGKGGLIGCHCRGDPVSFGGF